MSYIELVIRMSQESYNNLKIGCTQRVSDGEMIEALKNGTPLPKGHGRIDDAVSRQAVLDLVADDNLSMGQVVRGIHALPSVTPQIFC